MSKLALVNGRSIAALLALCLVLVLPSSKAAVTVAGQCEVTLLKGTTTIGKGTGTTEQQAWSSCIALIPQPSTATSGTASYTCQTPKCKYTATYSPEPIRSASLTWGTPELNPAGPITGYRIESGGLSTSVGLVNRYVFTNLAPGTHCYTIRALTNLNLPPYNESDPTDQVCKVIL